MGLAASQARLLTITSRMSSVELRQQRIAMDKMRLANDQDEVVEKYTNALNNKTLSISNGVQEVPMTYEALKSYGYQVAKASDASSISTVTVPRQTVVATPTVSNTTPITNTSSIKKPTCPRPEEIKRPAIIDQEADWCAAGTELAINTDGCMLGSRLFDMAHHPQFVHLNYTSSDNYFEHKDCYEWGVEYNNNSESEKGQEALNKLIKYTWEHFISSEMEAVVEKSESDEEKERAKLAVDLMNQHFEEVSNADYPDFKTANESIKFAFREMHHLLSGNYFVTNKPIMLDDETEWTTEVRNKVNASVTGETKLQGIARVDYNEEVARARAAWEKYDKAVASAGSTSSTSASSSVSSSPVISTGSYSSSSYVPSKDFEDQLKNSQFLIQGLLSGYLVLMKDGQQVSLSSATDIIESYDKSDDAAAEAEYNAQMSKINRKEKMLDMQAKRLDTEYSALTTEYDSVKNLIQNHTQKDFSYFS